VEEDKCSAAQDEAGMENAGQAIELLRLFGQLHDVPLDAGQLRHRWLDAAEPFGLAQPTISKHLRVLEEAGLIQQAARDAQRRPRTLVIGGPLKDIDVWLAPFREQWERRFDALDAFLQRDKPKKTSPKPKPTKGDRR